MQFFLKGGVLLSSICYHLNGILFYSYEPKFVADECTQNYNRASLTQSELFSRSTSTLPRSVPSGKERDAIINEYLDETGLVKVIESWIKQLTNEAELPYNPYPDLVWQARQHSERYDNFVSIYAFSG